MNHTNEADNELGISLIKTLASDRISEILQDVGEVDRPAGSPHAAGE